MALFQRLMNYLGYVPKQTIFSDVQDDKKVINEAKLEEIQTTLMIKPQNLYSLKFYEKENKRCGVYFGNMYLCCCSSNEKEDVESDFNKYKMGGYSTSQIKEKLRSKYSLSLSEAGRRGGKIGGKKSRRRPRTKYSFAKHKNNRLVFSCRFDDKLEKVCHCESNEKENVVTDCHDLLREGYTKEQIKFLLKRKYNRRQANGC